MSAAALFVWWPVAAGARAHATLAALVARGVAVLVLTDATTDHAALTSSLGTESAESADGWRALPLSAPLRARDLLLAARTHDLDLAQSWLITASDALAAVALQAGLYGVVAIGTGADRDDGVLIRYARDLSDVPRVLAPRGGGCWHTPG